VNLAQDDQFNPAEDPAEAPAAGDPYRMDPYEPDPYA